MANKWTYQTLTQYEVNYKYRVSEDGTYLVVQLITKVYRGLLMGYRRDAMMDAYEDYNFKNPDRQLIYPGAEDVGQK